MNGFLALGVLIIAGTGTGWLIIRLRYACSCGSIRQTRERTSWGEDMQRPAGSCVKIRCRKCNRLLAAYESWPGILGITRGRKVKIA